MIWSVYAVLRFHFSVMVLPDVRGGRGLLHFFLHRTGTFFISNIAPEI